MGVPTAAARTRIATGALIARLLITTALVGCFSVSHAQAQTAAARSFNIPAQPLSSALNAFGRQAGVQVTLAAATSRGVTSRAVDGSFTPQQALARLLEGTGIPFRINGDRTAVIGGAASGGNSAAEVAGAIPLDTIDVQGADQSPYGPGVGYVATRSATGTKSDTPIIETPQSISVVTRQQMDDQQVQSINEALRYTPGIVPEPYGIASNANSFNSIKLRGFTPEVYLDGLKDNQASTGLVNQYLLNRVEVLAGPASVLFGQGSPGGVVNLTSKLPTATPLHAIELGIGSYNHIQGAFDLGGPIDKDGQFLYRLTGIGFSQDTQTDFVKQQTVAIAPAFTWKPDADTTLTILGKYINQPETGANNGVPAQGTVLPNPNGRIPSNFYTGDPNFQKNQNVVASVGYNFEHRFDSVWTVRQNFRYAHIDSTGNSLLGTGLGSDLVTLGRYLFADTSHNDTVLVDNQAQAKFATGPLTHTALFGLDYQHFSENDVYGIAFAGVPSINIFAPVYYVNIPSVSPTSLIHYHETDDQTGLYAQDQIALDRWRFLIGAREDFNSANGVTTTNGASTYTNRFDKAFTWRTGLVYLFDNGIAPYASYSTSFQPTVGSSFAGTPFVPTTGQQYEAGIKYQPPGSNSFVTAAVYNLTQQNVLTVDPDPTHAGKSIQTGEIRARGVELQAHANINDNLSLIAAYTFTDAINTESNTTGTTIGGLSESTQGKRPVGIPEHMASLWGDYTFHGGALGGLGFGGGVRYVGPSYGDVVNSFEVSGVTLIDAALHYDLGEATPSLKGFKLQVNVSNLFDKTFVASCQSVTACSFGLRRTVYATLRYTW